MELKIAVPNNRQVEAICDELILEFYEDPKVSHQTSSHWKYFGKIQKMQKIEGKYICTGTGFGDFLHRGWKNEAFRWPHRSFLRKLLAEVALDLIDHGKDVARRSNRIFDYDLVRMILTVERLNRTLDLSDKTICVIGDGFGSLGSLIKLAYPNTKIISINLGKTLAFDVLFTGLVHPNAIHELLSTNRQMSTDFTYVAAEYDYESVTKGVDLFINVASFQEMDPSVVSQYFDLFRAQDSNPYIYACNREEKILPDGTISRFSDYGWSKDDEVIFDELCPWHQKCPISYPPFEKLFDGKHRHRLAKLRTSG